MNGIIGRERAQYDLNKLYNSGKSELLIVCGRRRVGNSYLIRQYFEGKLAFYATGMSACGVNTQHSMRESPMMTSQAVGRKLTCS